MKRPTDKPVAQRGASLIEAVIAIGVLAMAIPLVCSALAEAGKCALAARAETTSVWMVDACLNEIRASRDGCAHYLESTAVGQTFPPPGGVWAIAFSREGQPIGSLTQDHYAHGTTEVNGQTARYIAALASSMPPPKPGMTALLRVHISLEYPAAAPVGQRHQIDYYTHLP